VFLCPRAMARTVKLGQPASAFLAPLPLDCSAFAVRHTFIYVDDCSPSFKVLRKSRRSQTLPARVDGHVAIEEELEDTDGKSIAHESTAESNGSSASNGPCSGDSCSSLQTPASSLCHEASVPQEMPDVVPHSASAPRPLDLQWAHDNKGSFMVGWWVEARKLRSNGKLAISPSFELPLGPNGRSIQLRIAVYPKSANNFKSCKGKGCIQVKCESHTLGEPAPLLVTISVGVFHQVQGMRGPIEHDFSCSGMCALPRSQNSWDLSSSIEPESDALPICIGLCARPDDI